MVLKVSIVVGIFASLCCKFGRSTPDLFNSSCECAVTAGNKNSCCSSRPSAGEGTGSFCGSDFSKHSCGGDTPICCTSDLQAQCCVRASSCTAGCQLGFTCGCIEPPAPSTAGSFYNVPMARAYASLVTASQCGPMDALREFSCAACREVGFDITPGSMQFITNDWLGNGTSFAFVTKLTRRKDFWHNEFGCALVFRGTKNLANALEDAWAFQKPLDSVGNCTGCKVHNGFYDLWKAMRKDTLDALEKQGCVAGGDLGEIIVTGHSMGAGLASIAAFELQSLGYKVPTFYHFESPRIGNDAFISTLQTYFDRAISGFRITSLMDPVVHLPPEDLGYVHMSPEVYYYPSHNASEYVVCTETEDTRCSDRYSLLRTVASGADHCISSLVEGGNICACPFNESDVDVLVV